MNEANSLDDLQRKAVSALQRYQSGPENERTDALRATARAVVGARVHFFTKAGDPDWLGRTYVYRRWVKELMIVASIPAADISTVQAAVRYHTGTVLRQTVDAKTLDQLGLRTETPRERGAEKRDRNAAILSIFGGGGKEITKPDEIVETLRIIEAALRRIKPPTESERESRNVREAAHNVYSLITPLAAETILQP